MNTFDESLISSPFKSLPKELQKIIVEESGNPMLFRTCKYFNSFSSDPSFWQKVVKDKFGEIVNDFKNDLRIAIKRPKSWSSYITHLFKYHKMKLSYNTTYAVEKLQKRIWKEIETADPHPDIVVCPIDSNFPAHWHGVIIGPEGTPYAGGYFDIDILLPPEYPFKPPKFQFITKIFNPRVNFEGKICLDILKDSWHPALTVMKCMVVITFMMKEPTKCSDTCLNYEAALLLTEDRQKFDEKAREWTKLYAK